MIMQTRPPAAEYWHQMRELAVMAVRRANNAPESVALSLGGCRRLRAALRLWLASMARVGHK